MDDPTPPPLPTVFFTAEHQPEEIRAHVRRFGLRRVCRGAYVYPDGGAEAWQRHLTTHLARCQAIHRKLGDRMVLTGITAAAVHGLWTPLLGGEPVHVGQATGSRRAAVTEEGFARHWLRLEETEIVEVNGLPVTSIGRTVADCARLLSPEWALAVADCGLRTIIRPRRDEPDVAMAAAADLLVLWRRTLETECSPRGRIQARAVLAVANPLSESQLESRARCVLLAAGLPTPQLQCPIKTSLGISYSDMGIHIPEESRVLHIEADGKSKYAEDGALFAEKRREDAVRESEDRVLRVTSEQLHPSVHRVFVERVLTTLPRRFRREMAPIAALASLPFSARAS